MKLTRRTMLRPPPRKVRCPSCGRWVNLRGITRSVIPPHTTRRGIMHPDGTVTASGPHCPASCTRVRSVRDPEPRRDAPEGGAA